jgi:hypothetical protein
VLEASVCFVAGWVISDFLISVLFTIASFRGP